MDRLLLAPKLVFQSACTSVAPSEHFRNGARTDTLCLLRNGGICFVCKPSRGRIVQMHLCPFHRLHPNDHDVEGRPKSAEEENQDNADDQTPAVVPRLPILAAAKTWSEMLLVSKAPRVIGRFASPYP